MRRLSSRNSRRRWVEASQMDIKPDQMISLGYGKYWRSDDVVGLMRIEEDRGPGRRTAVYTASLPEPIVASRSENAILQDMADRDTIEMDEVRETLSDLLASFMEVPDVLKRTLSREAGLDTAMWVHRLRSLLGPGPDEPTGQNELFD